MLIVAVGIIEIEPPDFFNLAYLIIPTSKSKSKFDWFYQELARPGGLLSKLEQATGFSILSI